MEEQAQYHDSNKHIVMIIISVLLTAIIVGSAVYFWQKSTNERKINMLKQKISSIEEQMLSIKNTQIQITPNPANKPSVTLKPLISRSPTLTNSSTINWKTYTDSQYRFSFQYPSIYILGKLREDLPLLNHNIYWYISNHSYKDCRGDCPMTSLVKKITINNQEAMKIKGKIGAIGGNIPQSYVKYEIAVPQSSNYLIFVLWELPQDNLKQYSYNREPQEIPQKEESMFDRIVSTTRFLN